MIFTLNPNFTLLGLAYWNNLLVFYTFTRFWVCENDGQDCNTKEINHGYDYSALYWIVQIYEYINLYFQQPTVCNVFGKHVVVYYGYMENTTVISCMSLLLLEYGLRTMYPLWWKSTYIFLKSVHTCNNSLQELYKSITLIITVTST